MLNYRNTTIGFIVVTFLIIVLWIFDLSSIYWLAYPILLYLLFLILGSVNIQWNFYTKSIHRLKSTNQILLSFDDGPHPLFTLAILNLLDRYQAKAIFFLIGEQAEKYPQLVKEIVQRGHMIGNHSYSHADSFDFFSVIRMEQEVSKTNRIIEDICGQQPIFFRPPYGVTNPRIHRLIMNSGMKSVGWSFRSFDTTHRSNEQIIRKIRETIKGGEILLFHDRIGRTYQILEDVLAVLSERFELAAHLE